MTKQLSERNITIFTRALNGEQLTQLGREYNISSNRVSQILNSVRHRLIDISPLPREKIQTRCGYYIKNLIINKHFWLTTLDDLIEYEKENLQP